MAFEYLAMDVALLHDEISMRESAFEWSILRRVDSPFDLNESKFKSLFRVTPEAAHQIIDAIRIDLQGNTLSALSPESQVLAALRFYATGCYQRPVGNQKTITMSQSSVSRSIHRVTDAINSKLLRPNVRFPATHIERQAARVLFRTASQPFDGAIGAIDCAHVAIIGPPIHEEAYVNHHGYHSINVQMICDPNLRTLNVNARYPGARHDSFIWNSSAVRNAMERAFDGGDHQTFLIGDSGYALEPWLMTPLTNQPQNTPKFRYNKALCKSRNYIERTFGVLKGRFRCLLDQRVLLYEPGFAGKIVNACAVLHNLSVNMLTEDEILENLRDVAPVRNDNTENENMLVGSRSSVAKRIQDRLIAQKFT